MKKWIKRLAAVIASGILCVSLGACSLGDDKTYPVELDGTEVTVGKTKLSTLFDAGYTIEELNMSGIADIPVKASDQLEANSYYSGIKVSKNDEFLVMISIVTGKKAVPASDSVIAKVTASPNFKSSMDKITFDGVPLTKLTAEAFKEHVLGSTVNDTGTSAYRYGEAYKTDAEYSNGVLKNLEVARNYDIDYDSK